MKAYSKLLAVALAALAMVSCGDKDAVKPTKNLILLISDGTSTSLLSTARWYERYVLDSLDWNLNMDPYICGMVKSRLSDAVIPDSAPAMSGYTTGIPQRKGNISIYPESRPGFDLVPVDTAMTFNPAFTLLEAARTQGKSTGLVATVFFSHATPAATASHGVSRRAYDELSCQIASQDVDVVLTGGARFITDDIRSILQDNGTELILNDRQAYDASTSPKLWSLLADSELCFEMDRDPSKEASLSEMTTKAIDLLSKNKKGFFLMVEGSKVDYAAHTMAPEATITDFLEFDRSCKAALDFAKKNGNTTVVILADHGNSGISIADPSFRGNSAKGPAEIFLGMKDYKASYQKMTQLVSDAKIEDIPALFKEWENIDITEAEFNDLKLCKQIQEGNYMEVSNSKNLMSVVSEILRSRLHVGFIHGHHTGEDVYLAVYNPSNQRPCGIITNTELNEYMQQTMGLKKSLAELTREYYVKHGEVFPDAEFSIEKAEGFPVLTVSKNGKTFSVEANHAYGLLDGERVDFLTPAVYVKENGNFYIPRELGKLL